MVAFSVPEKVSKPLRSLSRSPLFMSVALHAAVLLVPLALWTRSQSVIPEADQVNLVQLPPITEPSDGSATAPLSDVPLTSTPSDGGFAAPDNGGFSASDDGFTASSGSGGFTASDGGFTASDGDSGFTASDGGFTPSDDDGFVPPADTPAASTRPAATTPSARTSAPTARRDSSTSDVAEADASATPEPVQQMAMGNVPAPSASTDSPDDAAPSDNGSATATVTPASRPTSAAPSAALPLFTGAQQVSFAVPLLYDHPQSYQTTAPIAVVKSWYEQQLRSRGYTVTPLENGTGRVVLALTRAGMTQYLHLLERSPQESAASAATEPSGTNIVVTATPLPGNVQNLPTETGAIAQFFRELNIPAPGEELDAAGNRIQSETGEDLDPKVGSTWRTLTVEQLPTPTAFYQSAESQLVAPALPGQAAIDCATTPAQCQRIQPPFVEGVRRGVVRFGQPDPDAVMRELMVGLQGYQVSRLPNSYGGGLLYQIQRDRATAYLSLVPTKDGTSTAVILWNRDPRTL
ncbi:MAG TPA: hypothetical protein IGS37_14070 [Synechococcales cyanobacterium M55_K2018_004]|nr:hypothetical protein [Synechococcales cyanobacterium M55_K2018_004]